MGLLQVMMKNREEFGRNLGAVDQYLDLIEQMVKQVNSFSSQGSGWLIDRIEKLQICFAAFSPIRAGSYLELSDALSAASTLLTNINTKDDNR